jgi:hypothetical protein
MKLQTIFILFSGLFFLFAGCGTAPNLAGDASETGNSYISGTVSLPSGQRAPNTQVMLIPRSYNPVTDGPVPESCIDTTNAEGEYRFFISNKGEFSIQGVQIYQRTRLLVDNVVTQSDTTIVPNTILQKPGAIRILISSGIDRGFGYLYVPGTTRFVFLADKGDFAVIDSVPAGSGQKVCYNALNRNVPSSVVGDSVTVSPGALVTLNYYEWKHSRALWLNTGRTGANVAGTVVNFPVLVRLTKDNFNFSDALADGGDIRFTNAGGSPLPYEIEQWDAVAQKAALWVKIDTVYGNDSTHCFIMYWGASTSSATNLSNSAAVFDTSNGFGAVWHLANNGTDATAGGHEGTVYGTSDSTGIIGIGKKFNGRDSIVIEGLFDSMQTLTLSAWARLDSADGFGGEVISVGDDAILRTDDKPFGTEASMHSAGTADTSAIYSRIPSGQFVARTGWHYLTATFDGATRVQIFYLDGAEAARLSGNLSIVYQGLGRNTCIGKHGNGNPSYDFMGMIDEVRVCRVVRSADWTKLSFMNQKATDMLVMFK